RQQLHQSPAIETGPDLGPDGLDLIDDRSGVLMVPRIGDPLAATGHAVAVDRRHHSLDLRLDPPRDAEGGLQASTLSRAGEGLKHSSNRSMMGAAPWMRGSTHGRPVSRSATRIASARSAAPRVEVFRATPTA